MLYWETHYHLVMKVLLIGNPRKAVASVVAKAINIIHLLKMEVRQILNKRMPEKFTTEFMSTSIAVQVYVQGK